MTLNGYVGGLSSRRSFLGCFRTRSHELEKLGLDCFLFENLSIILGTGTSTIQLSLQSSSHQMGSLPTALLIEVRHAFRSCSRQYVHVPSQRTSFSTLSPRLKNLKPTKSTKNPPIQVVHYKQQKLAKEQERRRALEEVPADSKQLVSQHDQATSLDTGRKVSVPLKVIPKAQITPTLRLSPKERLQIEQLTRVTPSPAPPPGT